MPSIAELPALLRSLEPQARGEVERLLAIDELEGSLEVPEPLRAKVARWCGATDASSSVWTRVQCQRVVSVTHRWTYETCNFNPLRASRPVAGPVGGASPDEIADACDGAGRCDFCDVERLTSVEPFGRVRGRCCMTAGNAFKSAGLHGLLIWARHAPHRLTEEEYFDGFQAVDGWFERALAWDRSQGSGLSKHEILFWNLFRGAGASQIHPHMQMQLFERPQGPEALLRDQSERYRQQFPEDDLVSLMARVSEHLGLALTRQELDAAGLSAVTSCWAGLTPRVGGGELVVVGEVAAEGRRPLAASLAAAVAAAHAALRACGAESISSAACQVETRGGRAWLMRCWHRGTAAATVVDAGSTELIGIAGGVCDPFALLAAFRAALPKPAQPKV